MSFNLDCNAEYPIKMKMTTLMRNWHQYFFFVIYEKIFLIFTKICQHNTVTMLEQSSRESVKDKNMTYVRAFQK